jgi:hypothetical protein
VTKHPGILATPALILILAACGSSKPAYCTQVSDLKKSVQGLGSISSVSELQTQAKKISTQAQSAISSAKGDFPNETAAVSNSLKQLESTVKQLPSSPSASQVAALTSQASSAVTAIKNFTNATSSKCG